MLEVKAGDSPIFSLLSVLDVIEPLDAMMLSCSRPVILDTTASPRQTACHVTHSIPQPEGCPATRAVGWQLAIERLGPGWMI